MMVKQYQRTQAAALPALRASWQPALLSALLLCAALLLGACGTNQTASRAPTAAPQATGVPMATPLPGATAVPSDDGGLEAVTFSDIADNPDLWVGKRVTVRGNLDELVGQRAFTLSEPGLGADSFLVVAQAPNTIPMEEPIFGEQGAGAGEQVQATGIVQRYDLLAVERGIDADLQDELFAAFTQEDLVIIASSINVIGDQAQRGQQDGEAAQIGDQIPDVVRPTVAQIMENPEQYLGKVLTITGDAEEIIGSRAFKLDEDNLLAGGIDNDLLVIGATLTEPQFDNGLLDDQVEVTGTLHLFDRELLSPIVGYDLQADLYQGWDNRPVLVADSVRLVD